MKTKFVSNYLPKIEVSFHRLYDEKHDYRVRSSLEAYELFMSLWNTESIDLLEEMKVIYLDRKNSVIGFRNLSRGNSSGTVVDCKLIILIALECNAESFILCHNHPSGRMKPSNSDVTITKKIQEGAKLFDLKLLDHLIISKKEYFSMADEGHLESI